MEISDAKSISCLISAQPIHNPEFLVKNMRDAPQPRPVGQTASLVLVSEVFLFLAHILTKCVYCTHYSGFVC